MCTLATLFTCTLLLTEQEYIEHNVVRSRGARE